MINPVLNESSQLISSVQDLTDTASDLGTEINVKDVKILNVYLDIDINSSQNVRISFKGKLAPDASNEYQISSIASPVAGVSNIDTWYGEVTTDSDQKITIPIVLNRSYLVLQLQVWAGTVGATAGQIESAYITVEMDNVR